MQYIYTFYRNFLFIEENLAAYEEYIGEYIGTNGNSLSMSALSRKNATWAFEYC